MKFTISNRIHLKLRKDNLQEHLKGYVSFLYMKPCEDFADYGNARLEKREGENYLFLGINATAQEFSWDGCSPKFKLFGKEFGTWDGKVKDKHYNELNPIPEDKPETYYASLVHDFIYQSKGTFTRKEADAIFKELLEQQKFKYTNLYYFFVRMFGWIWWIT